MSMVCDVPYEGHWKGQFLGSKQTIFSKVFLDFLFKIAFLHILRNSTSASFKSGASLWPSKFEEPLHAVSPLGDAHTHEHGEDSAIET